MTELNNEPNNMSKQDSSMESPSRQDDNAEPINEAPIIPVIETTYPRSPMASPLPNDLIIVLAKAEPSDILNFMEKYHEGERNLRELTIKNQHELEIKREESRSKVNVNTKQLSQFTMGIFAILFSGVLLYAHVSGDKALPDSVIKLMAGALAGGGGVTLLHQNSKKDKE